MQTPDKVDINTFYLNSHNEWKYGSALFYNAESKKIAEVKSCDEFIYFIDELIGNSLKNIDKSTGFFDKEFLLHAYSNKLILTNKRCFISSVEDISKGFDYYFFENIISIFSIHQNSTLVFEFIDRRKSYEKFDVMIVQDVVEKSSKLIHSNNSNLQSSDLESNRKHINIRDVPNVNHYGSSGRTRDHTKYQERNNNKDGSFPIYGFVIGGIGFAFLVALFLPKGYAISNKLLIIGIFVVGGIIGSAIENYYRK